MSENGTQLVTTQQPHIETLQVSVQVVRIGPKQMTQAVFRQLPYEDIVSRVSYHPTPQVHFEGVVWGRVRYYWLGCHDNSIYEENSEPHTHVVWQWQDTLYRSCVPCWLPNRYSTPHIPGHTIPRAVVETLREQWRALFARVMASPQLFIAV